MPQITLKEKIIAILKGELLGKPLIEKEYYYLMFGCETDDEIVLIKSMTLDECKYYLDCCWYLGIEHPEKFQLEFMRRYRKFSKGKS